MPRNKSEIKPNIITSKYCQHVGGDWATLYALEQQGEFWAAFNLQELICLLPRGSESGARLVVRDFPHSFRVIRDLPRGLWLWASPRHVFSSPSEKSIASFILEQPKA